MNACKTARNETKIVGMENQIVESIGNRDAGWIHDGARSKVPTTGGCIGEIHSVYLYNLNDKAKDNALLLRIVTADGLRDIVWKTQSAPLVYVALQFRGMTLRNDRVYAPGF